MDPTALVMEQLAHEWAACLVGFSALAMRGTVVLVATLVLVAALASLPVAGQRQQAAGDGEHQPPIGPQPQPQPDGASSRRPTSLRLVAAATAETGPLRSWRPS